MQPRDCAFIDSQVCDVTHTLSLVTTAHIFLSASSLVAQSSWWGQGKIGGATLTMTVSGLCCRNTLHDTGLAISLLICTNVQRRKSIHLVSSLFQAVKSFAQSRKVGPMAIESSSMVRIKNVPRWLQGHFVKLCDYLGLWYL